MLKSLMHLNNLPDDTLLKTIRDLVAREREISLQILHHLREVERRRLFAVLGYASLFEYCVQELEYSNGSAHRRIASMRLLKELPEIEEKIAGGRLNLSLVSRAQSFFKQEEIEAPEAKRAIIALLMDKSDREAERELARRATAPASIRPERTRAITERVSEIRFAAENEFLEEIEELRALLAHARPGMSIAEALKYGIQLALDKHRPKKPIANPVDATSPDSNCASPTPLPAQEGTPRRAPTAAIKRAVWARDGGRCTYSHGGRRCTSRYALEFDHIRPWALGGETNAENLRLRCRAHNQLGAIRVFGREQIAEFVPAMRP